MYIADKTKTKSKMLFEIEQMSCANMPDRVHFCEHYAVATFFLSFLCGDKKDYCLWGPNNLMLVRIDNPGQPSESIVYFFNNYLVNNMTTTDDSGDVLTHNQYSAWGEPTNVYQDGSYSKNDFVFTSKLYDSETESYNLEKRV